MGLENKEVWVWTENNAVMTAAVERGWNTFLFTRETRYLALEWSCELLLFSDILSFELMGFFLDFEFGDLTSDSTQY